MIDLYANWREKIAAGDKIRPFGSMNYCIMLTVMTIGAVFCLYLCAEILRLLVTGRAGPLASNEPVEMMIAPVFSLVWLVITIRAAWGPRLFSSLRFSPDYLGFRDWRNRQHRIYFDDILLLVWESRSKSASRWSIRLFYRNKETLRPTWANLSSEAGWQAGLPEMVRQALVRRAGLERLGAQKPEDNFDDDSAWAKSELPGFESGKYTLPKTDQLAPLALGLLIVAFCSFAVWALFGEW